MYKVILVDDSSLSLEGMKANIDFPGLDAQLVGAFMSGSEVLAFLRNSEPVDLLISDIRMPNMNGLELARCVFELQPQIKIIFISAYDDFEYAKEALQIGAVDYVQKPIRYEMLANAIRKATEKIKEEKKIRRHLEEILPEMKRFFFWELVHMPPFLAKMQMQEQANELGISAQEKSYLCVNVAIEDRADIPVQDHLIRQVSLFDHLENWLKNRAEYWSLRDRGQLVFIFYNESCNRLQQNVLTLIRDYLDDHPQSEGDLFVGVGQSVSSLWDLSLSMEQAEIALNRRYIHPDQNVFHYSEESHQELSNLGSLSEWKSELLNQALTGDTDRLKQTIMELTDIITHRFTSDTLIVPSVCMICGDLLHQIHHSDMDLASLNESLDRFSQKQRVNSFELSDFLQHFFEKLMTVIEESKQNSRRHIVDQAKEYVREHIADEKLHVEMIAQTIHVSSSHLSRCFKSFEGCSMNEYITMLRMETAKKDLAYSNKSVQEISESIGYASPYYFSACFKKAVGMSPTEYRNKIK